MNNPKARQEWIIEYLSDHHGSTYTEVFAAYSPMYAKTKKTFDKDWKAARVVYERTQAAIQRAKEKARIKQEVTAVEYGIKTKQERVLILQEQINNSLSELRDGTTTHTQVRSGKAVVVTRDMTVKEKALLRRTIKDLQAEISKIEGDYAATKIQGIGKIEFTPIPESS